MTIEFTDKQRLLLRKNAMPVLRKMGGKAEGIELHKLEWKALNDLRSQVMRTARDVVDDMRGDISLERSQEFEETHDALMELFDRIELEKDARSEAGDRGPRKTDNSRLPIPPPASARGRDDGWGDLETADSEEVFALRADQSVADWVRRRHGMAHHNYRGISAGQYLRAMIVGPSNDIERRALSEGTDSAGGYTVPDILSAGIIDRLRASSTVFKAGARVVPLTSDTNYIAKVLTDPTPAWRSEAGSIAESDPTFGRVTLTPRSLGVIIKVSRELIEDSLNISTALPQVIAQAMAAEVDRVALMGSGTPPEPEGVANFGSLTANAFAGGTLTGYTPFIQARTALRTANSDVTAYIMHPREEGALAGGLDGEGRPLVPPPAIANMPMLVTTKIPINGGAGTNESSIFAGDWSRLLIGMRTDLRIEILKERYADTHQYGFVAFLRADVAAEHEAAFTVLEAITP